MPGGAERALKRRITSVQSTKKITRAMELIATTRVAKAQQRANASRPYSEKMTGVIEDLAQQGAEVQHPLLRADAEVKNVGVVMICSDRGLAGPYNSQVIRTAEREIVAEQQQGRGYEIITLGKKARDYFSFRGYKIARSFEQMSDTPTYENAREAAQAVAELFLEEKADEIRLIYTEFISLGVQKVVVRKFLPLSTIEDIAREGGGTTAGGAEGQSESHTESRAAFEFEPSPEGILENLLPRYVESRLFSAMLDAAASEHANRQRAMKAATDNAEELITKLTRQMNRARQDAITTEIMEIVGGAEALKESDMETDTEREMI